MGNELVAQDGREIVTRLNVSEVKAQMDALEELMRICLKKGDLGKGNEGDYYILPGGKKPCLSKAGAQKVATMFRFAASYPIIEDLSTANESRYRVLCRLNRPDGLFVGEQWGEASSAESKNRWRKALDDDEFADAHEDEKRIIKRKNQNGDVYEVKQIMVNRADSTTNVLPKAQKRAYVQVVLAASGASCLFTSGLESDDPDHDHDDGNGKKPHEPIRAPQAKKAPADGGDDIKAIQAVVTRVAEKPTAKGGTRFGVCLMDGWYNTFDEKIAAVCAKGAAVTVHYKVGQYGNDIVSAEIYTEQPGEAAE